MNLSHLKDQILVQDPVVVATQLDEWSGAHRGYIGAISGEKLSLYLSLLLLLFLQFKLLFFAHAFHASHSAPVSAPA